LSLAIDIRNLRFKYPKSTADCLSIQKFQVETGERVFVHGPSGCGKSTLLGLIGGVLLADEGEVEILGQHLSTLSLAARDQFRADHIGFIFQQFNLIPYLSVMDNVLLPCRFSDRRLKQTLNNGNTLQAQAMRLMTHLEIDQLKHHSVLELSVGQQQRVAAARALIGNPQIVIADEPTSSLDANRQSAFLELLARECAATGATLVFVSHDRRLVQYFDREISLPSINQAAFTEAML
jgi:putative ABC transport system ATP-binding protein